MALRHSEEIPRRLSPEEVRAFLQVHAEREAAGTASDAPTAEDLAETLGLSPEETRSILDEARARTLMPEKATRKHGAARTLALPLFVLAIGLAASLAWLNVRAARPAPEIMPDRRTESLPPVQAASSIEANLAPGVRPPDGFEITIESTSATFSVSGATLNDGSDYGRLAPAEANAARARLVASILDLAWAKVPEADWANLQELTLFIGIQGGRWTKLVVPVASSVPFRRNEAQAQEALRNSLARVVEAAWPQIVRPAS